MATFNYKSEAERYRYYYQRLQIFYRKPIVQVSTAVLFTLVTISFFAAFAIRPTLQTIAELLKKINDQKQVLALAQKKTASLATAQQQYEMVYNNLAALNTAIPATYQPQTLLKQIEAEASQLGISLNSLQISDLQYPPDKTAEDSIKEISFLVSLEAPYPIAKQFLSALTQLPRLITVNTVSISTPQKKGQAVQADTIELTANCTAFFGASSGEDHEVGNQ